MGALFSLFIALPRRSLVAFISPVLHHLPQQVGLTAMVAARAGKLCCAVTIRFAFLFGEPFYSPRKPNEVGFAARGCGRTSVCAANLDFRRRVRRK